MIERPATKDGAASESITNHQRLEFLPLIHQLTHDVPADRAMRTAEQQARWLLANMLDWYRREKKADWWEYFRLLSLPEEELLEEKEAIAGLKFAGKSIPVKRSFAVTYTFPVQECEILPGDTLVTADGEKFGEVISIDKVTGILEVKKGASILDLHPSAVITFSDISPGEKEDAIIRLAQWVVDYSMDEDGSYRAARDLFWLCAAAEDGKDFRAQGLATGKCHRLDATVGARGATDSGASRNRQKSHCGRNYFGVDRRGEKSGYNGPES